MNMLKKFLKLLDAADTITIDDFAGVSYSLIKDDDEYIVFLAIETDIDATGERHPTGNEYKWIFSKNAILNGQFIKNSFLIRENSDVNDEDMGESQISFYKEVSLQLDENDNIVMAVNS